MMSLIRFFDKRVRRLTIWDIKLAQGCAMLLAVIIVKLIPDILRIDFAWMIALTIILAIRPMYAFFFKRTLAEL
jgi:hypothetical protein